MPRRPKAETAAPLPRVHELKLSDNQSRLVGLLWDKFIAEASWDIELALALTASIHTHIEQIEPEQFNYELVDLKQKLDMFWKVHGCGCGSPECRHNERNPNNQLGSFGADDITIQ